MATLKPEPRIQLVLDVNEVSIYATKDRSLLVRFMRGNDSHSEYVADTLSAQGCPVEAAQVREWNRGRD